MGSTIGRDFKMFFMLLDMMLIMLLDIIFTMLSNMMFGVITFDMIPITATSVFRDVRFAVLLEISGIPVIVAVVSVVDVARVFRLCISRYSTDGPG